MQAVRLKVFFEHIPDTEGKYEQGEPIYINEAENVFIELLIFSEET